MKKLVNYTLLLIGILMVWAIALVVVNNTKVARELKKSTSLNWQPIVDHNYITLTA